MNIFAWLFKKKENSSLKRIKELEAEIARLKLENEDLEDEIDESNAELRKKNAEVLQLEDEISSLKKEYTDEKQKISVELENSNKNSEKKQNALSFVGDVLSAINSITEAKDTDGQDNLVEIERIVDEISDYIKFELKHQLSELKIEFPEELSLAEGGALEQWKAITKKTWLDGKTTIAFIGEFSAGKTSIINTILGSGDIELPVNTKPTTAIPTYIIGEENSRGGYRFVSPDNKLKRINRESFIRLDKETIAEIKGIDSLIKYFVMITDNPNLKKLSILDTPGFSSNDERDEEKTIEIINECDALFWVFDINNGTVNKSSCRTLKKYLKKPLYLIINKIDTKAESEVDKVEKNVQEIFSNEGIRVQQILRYSKYNSNTELLEVLSKVKKTNESSTYLKNLLEFLKRQREEQGNKLFESEKKLKESRNSLDDKTDEIDCCIQELRDSISQAENMFDYEKRILGGMRAEMSKYRFENEFVPLMEKLSNDYTIKLEKAMEDLKTCTKNVDDSRKDINDWKIRTQKLDYCLSILEKKVKDLDTIRYNFR